MANRKKVSKVIQGLSERMKMIDDDMKDIVQNLIKERDATQNQSNDRTAVTEEVSVQTEGGSSEEVLVQTVTHPSIYRTAVDVSPDLIGQVEIAVPKEETNQMILKLLGSFREKGVGIAEFKGSYSAVYGQPLNFEYLLELVVAGSINIDKDNSKSVASNEYFH